MAQSMVGGSVITDKKSSSIVRTCTTVYSCKMILQRRILLVHYSRCDNVVHTVLLGTLFGRALSRSIDYSNKWFSGL